MEEKLRDIERDISSEDYVSLYRNSHAIKSMSANIGAHKVRSISAHIEELGRQNELSGLAEAINSLEQAYQEFLLEFDAALNN